MEPTLEYLAGFFDGEGSIGIYRNGRGDGRTLRVQITQNVSPLTTDLLNSCWRRWGGSLSAMNRSLHRPAWNYQASAASGALMLRQLRPHLILKAEQADIALAWWDSRPEMRRDPRGRNTPYPAAYHEAGLAAELALKAAKKESMN